MSFITVKNLNFKYPNGTENVLNDVSLEVTKGEKVAIIGQNGDGKNVEWTFKASKWRCCCR